MWHGTIGACGRWMMAGHGREDGRPMSGWDNFFIAQVGASAAFAGLVFVGVSINLTKIVAVPRQVGFALEALVVLLDVLITSSLLLVPGQPPAYLAAVSLGQAATLPFLLVGLALIARGAGGLYWIIPGVVFSFLDAFYLAWVLLIEINR